MSPTFIRVKVNVSPPIVLLILSIPNYQLLELPASITSYSSNPKYTHRKQDPASLTSVSLSYDTLKALEISHADQEGF